MFKNFQKKKYNSGVTLIELLVVITIFMIISTITIFDYGKFRFSTSIQNLADDIALSVRKAQSYAIGVRGYGASFGEGYGIHFMINPVASSPYSGSNKSFIIFVDIDKDGKYDFDSTKQCGTPELGNECLEVLNIISTDKISGINYKIRNSDPKPLDVSGVIDISFKRPNPEPTFCNRYDNINSSSCGIDSISFIEIKITNDINPGIFKIVTIWNNGQISVS